MSTENARTRYVIIGMGSRCRMYTDAIAGPHADVAELVALADTNPGRVEYHRSRIREEHGADVATFDPAALTSVIQEQRIDRVIITSPDFTHADYIVESLQAGADVVVEKPLTVDAESSARIARTVEATGREVIVTFNYRYSPRNTALKAAILEGRIGQVTSIDFTWVLDTVHGADYFRRWHRVKENSGGLLIHKASHHFDLVNWWLADVPERIYASGGLKFYGAKNAAARGIAPAERGTREGSSADPFALDLRTDETLQKLYLDNEHHDGYIRDQDVFGEGITIEDNLALIVDYTRGAVLNYSLNAHAPWEGYRVAVNGTEGRLELDVVERAAVLPASGGSPVDPSVADDGRSGAVRSKGERLVLQRHWGEAEELEIVQGEGAHGGGDRLLLADIFNGPGEDPYARPAGLVDGIQAIAVGVCGNRSLQTRGPVTVAEVELGLASGDASGTASGAMPRALAPTPPSRTEQGLSRD
ncbi:Gfo/Idh/MocA family oxidoreductase [Nesterenkonia sp. CL21]|uniref:Gfo/Idh/MocA family protein n=1 Tax=Nesterenkonia sp. CL21 TaxID=3064894 RepID=UPI0028793555|nr:Gfo/Idh/MocA family oxidoreductase [Nesterenkonia sp. CL21]MDS2172690.1 Gfo/Idh/MocA family oxidoreductase [Nesterenkonia sp. CL21]